MVLQFFGICMLERMDGINVGEKKKKKILKRSQLWGRFWRKGSLVGSQMWPWGASGQFLILRYCSAYWQFLICRTPCASWFLILISSATSARILSPKFLKLAKTQPHILNYQILDVCRVLYRTASSHNTMFVDGYRPCPFWRVLPWTSLSVRWCCDHGLKN